MASHRRKSNSWKEQHEPRFRALALLFCLLCCYGTSNAQPAAAILSRITGAQAARLTANDAIAAAELAAALNASQNAAITAALFGLKPSEPVTFDHAAGLLLEGPDRDFRGIPAHDAVWTKAAEIRKKYQSPLSRAAFRGRFRILLLGALQKAGAKSLQEELIKLPDQDSAAWYLLGEGSVQYLARWNDKPRHPIGVLVLAEMFIAAAPFDQISGLNAAEAAILARLTTKLFQNQTEPEIRGKLFAAYCSEWTNRIWKVPYEDLKHPLSEGVLVMPLAPNGIFLGGRRFLRSRPKSATLVASVAALPRLTQQGWIEPISDVELHLLSQTPAQFAKAVPPPLKKVQLGTASSSRSWIWFDNSKEFSRALASASVPPGTPPTLPPPGKPASFPIDFDGDDCDVQLCVNKEGASATFGCGNHEVSLSTSGSVSISIGADL